MSKFSLIYFLLWILLQVLVDVNCQSTPFKPNVIYRHTATFVDNKLYILGDLSNINIIPLHTDATSTKGGVNNDTLYLYGGASSDKNNGIGVVDSNGKFYFEGSLVNAPTPRFHYGATLLPNNKIIYFGGTNDINFGKTLNLTKGALALNEVYIYDTVNDNWDTKITMGNIPSKRVDFSTILGLDGQRIIIYGGYLIIPDIRILHFMY
ncbi:unnamed protein product [Rhizophagus irregularis]|nr:unnamed protein product [Rhizophagus irregularis]